MEKKSKLKIYLIRGAPGSGKSTLANNVFVKKHGFQHFENDQFLYDENGKYVWTPERAKEAVQKCRLETEKALAAGKNVVVSNVFVTKKSIKWYEQCAKKHGAEFKIFRKDASYGNIHDVPKKTYDCMKAHFEDIPGEIRVDKLS